MSTGSQFDDLTRLWRSDNNPHMFLVKASSVLDFALQPIVDMHSGDTYGFEALLRNVDRMGFKHPGEVFDFAYEIGCLAKLELMLRRKVIEKFADVRNRTSSKLYLNIDVRILETDGGLLGETVSLLSRHGFTPTDVCMELTETFNNASCVRVSAFVEEARAMGFAFAIDDFGQGYSQFRVLYECQSDTLKIDRFFITSMQSDSRKRLFVSSVVDLAHVLGMRVVAEGVETEEEFNACREIGCDLVQGYYVARPSVHLMDAMPAYPHVARAKERRQIAKSDEDFVLNAIKELPTVYERDTMDAVLRYFRNNLEINVVPVLNSRNEPRGVIREADLKVMLYLPFGQDLLRNPSVHEGLTRFVRPAPIADIHSRLDRLIDSIAEDEHDGVVITKNGKYFGFLTVNALLKISNDIRLRQAEDQNPLTKLPGNATINTYVAAQAVDLSTDRFFCYVDFDNFKPFNDTYGFRLGDRAIVLFSDLVKRKLGDKEAFVGHVGGDDFFVGLNGRTIDAVLAKMSALRADFAHEAESFYSPQHRAQGFIEATDRFGEERQFPLLTCSIGILHLAVGHACDDEDMLAKQIALLKSESKAATSGVASATLSGDALASNLQELRHVREVLSRADVA